MTALDGKSSYNDANPQDRQRSPKSARRSATLLLRRRTHPPVLAGADLLGNAILSRTPDDPTYAEVAPLLPPVLATSLHCGDFALDTQSFVGSRVATEKRSFSAMGVDAWANTRQQYHFDVEQLSLNNTRAVRKPPARASTPSLPPIPPNPPPTAARGQHPLTMG